MTGYLVRRLGSGVLVIAALLVLTFFATHVIGDPLALILDSETATEEDRQALLRASGLDRPVWVQFVDYASRAAVGDFGQSLWQNRPATQVVLERVPMTVQLAAISVGFTLLVSIPLAAWAASNTGRWPDLLVTTVTTAMGSIVPFWWGLSLILVLAVQLRWLPTSGSGSWQHVILPVLTLSLGPIARLTQVLQTSIAAEVHEQYALVARSKGLRGVTVMSRHVLRNAALPAVTVLAMEMVVLLSSTVLVESIFAWPGMGQVALQAVQRRDLPVLIAAVFYTGVLVTLTNLVVDLLYPVLDPRVRLA